MYLSKTQRSRDGGFVGWSQLKQPPDYGPDHAGKRDLVRAVYKYQSLNPPTAKNQQAMGRKQTLARGLCRTNAPRAIALTAVTKYEKDAAVKNYSGVEQVRTAPELPRSFKPARDLGKTHGKTFLCEKATDRIKSLIEQRISAD
jgi:hypothetical protein